jgi:hypothetical protein
MTDNTSVYMTQFVNGQFPSFYEQDGPLFIAFTKAYYEYLSMPNNTIYHIKNIQSYNDIDTTPDSFLIYFQDQYLGSLPKNLAVSPRLLIKHIQDLWRATGTKRGYELLFRILFNEDINFYFPGQNLFKPSNNNWVQEYYIEVSYSIILPQLVGLKIYSSSGLATAIVEDYNVISTNNKIINVLILSHVTGNFQYEDNILCENLDISNNSPIVIGSLSAVSITDGGVLFNVGDIVNISGSGTSALGRISSVVEQNGKVIFNLVNGGNGFTMNPQIQVVGGGGSGATFSVGSLVNQQIYILNTDIINNYLNTQLDNTAEGFTLSISNASATFTVGEAVVSSANGLMLDITYNTGSNLTINEFLSNTVLGISNLQVVKADGPNFAIVTGPQTSLTNANINGSFVKGSISGSIIKINYILNNSITNFTGNGTVIFSNSSIVTVNMESGYYLPTSTLISYNANAYINSIRRNTDWGFPIIGVNLDSVIGNSLTNENLVTGTIASLTRENPGEFYTSNPTVSIFEPLIYQLQIPDGNGGYYGGDANVSAIANSESGIITSLQIVDSGYGFLPNESVDIYGNSAIFASGKAVVDGTGITQGYWTDNQSFPSDQIYIEDSYYYQPFAYEIIAPRMLNTYQQFVMDIVHPVQMKMFGRFAINDIQDSDSQIISTQTLQVLGANTIIEEN